MAKQSEVAKQYKKQLRRIKRFIKSATARGYDFDFELPKTPKKITSASVRKLQKITPEYLYKKATYFVEDTGEYISGLKGRKYERSEAGKKGYIHKLNKEAKAQQETPKRKTKTKSSGASINVPPPEHFKYEDLPDRADVTVDFSMKESLDNIREIVNELLEKAEEIPTGTMSALLVAKTQARITVFHLLTLDTQEKKNRVAKSLVDYQTQDTVRKDINIMIYASTVEQVYGAEHEFVTALNSGSPLTLEESATLTEARDSVFDHALF